MQLTIREAAKLLDVSERAVYRWLDEGDIPAIRIDDDVRFNRAELLEWATLRRLPISGDILQEPANGSSLSSALERGGVHHGVAAKEPLALLRAVVAELALPAAERQLLLDMLLARGSQALTLVEDGIAIPHARHPAVASVPKALVALYFLDEPGELKTPDGKPLDTVFFVVSPSARVHLRLLSRLAAALHHKALRTLLAARGTQEEILAGLRRIEGSR